MAFKLIEAAQARWRAVNAPHLVPLVRAGATFTKGKLVERDTETAQNGTPKQPKRRKPPKRTPSTGLDYYSRILHTTVIAQDACRRA